MLSPPTQALLDELDADPDARAQFRRLLAPEKPEPDDAPLLTSSQAALLAGVHVETIRRAVRERKLRASYVGRSLRIAPADLQAWLSSNRPQHPSSQPRSRRSNGKRPLAGALASLDK
jgi:excisionase family DNA binding protein